MEYVAGYTRYTKFVPTEAALEFCVAGNVEDCTAKIEEFVKAGVKHFILQNVGPDRRRFTETACKKIIPRFKEYSFKSHKNRTRKHSL